MKFLKLKCLFVACFVLAVGGAYADESDVTITEGDENVTVITSDKLTFDHRKQYAVFEGNVVVQDPELELTARTLTVRFDDDGQLSSIRAEGDVVMSQSDKQATARLAAYDVESGKIVLSGKPRVARGRDVLEGEVITFWRDENRMVCEPKARLMIYPEGGSRNLLLGD